LPVSSVASVSGSSIALAMGQLDGDLSPHRFGLLRQVDGSHSSLAELGEQPVGADGLRVPKITGLGGVVPARDGAVAGVDAVVSDPGAVVGAFHVHDSKVLSTFDCLGTARSSRAARCSRAGGH
jgi:hypothetical protein